MAREDHPVVQVPWFDAVANAGWAKKACPPRPSGNMRRGVTWLANASPGAIPLRKGDKLANIWQGWLSMKKSAHRWLHLVAPSLPTAMGYPTWSTTPGIGAPTGVGLMRMPPRQMVRGSCRPYRKLGSARPSGAQACHPGWFFSLLSQLLRKLSPGSPPWHLARYWHVPHRFSLCPEYLRVIVVSAGLYNAPCHILLQFIFFCCSFRRASLAEKYRLHLSTGGFA